MIVHVHSTSCLGTEQELFVVDDPGAEDVRSLHLFTLGVDNGRPILLLSGAVCVPPLSVLMSGLLLCLLLVLPLCSLAHCCCGQH